MREKLKKIRSEESGIYLIEAIYVVLAVMLVIFFTFNVAIVYYNRQVVTAVADQAASGVAQIYGERTKEPFYNFTDYKYFSTKNAYRYLAAGSIKDMAEKKAKWYASYLIYKREFSTKHSKDFSDIQVIVDDSELKVKIITVKIKREYPVFELNPVVFWGLDPKYEVEAEGTAVCYDVLHDMNATSFKNEVFDTVDAKSTIVTMVKDIVDLYKKCAQFIKGKEEAANSASSGG